MKRSIFLDFDGTITKKDTGVAMTEAFARGDWQQINQAWQRREISTETRANRKFQLFAGATPERLRELFQTIEIDDYFHSFLHFCQQMDYRVTVLSDGYDLSIRTVFDRYRIRIPYYCNGLAYQEGNFRMICRHPNPSCGHCGTCKRRLLGRLREEGSETVYIGDGYSDVCVAGEADLVFAKDDLYSYCIEHGREAVPFDHFGDIINYLSEGEPLVASAYR